MEYPAEETTVRPNQNRLQTAGSAQTAKSERENQPPPLSQSSRQSKLMKKNRQILSHAAPNRYMALNWSKTKIRLTIFCQKVTLNCHALFCGNRVFEPD
jgi:hypothetical protein